MKPITTFLMVSGTIFFVLSLFSPAGADTLHVPRNYATIQSAIDAAEDGDMVLVDEGTYFERIEFIGKNIIIKGVKGADATFIDPEQIDSAIRCLDSFDKVVHLEGFTITNGLPRIPEKAGGLFSEKSTLHLNECTFDANLGRNQGGAIYTYQCDLTITNCIFRNNSSAQGGAIFNKETDMILNNCLFEANVSISSSGAAIKHRDNTLSMSQCVFTGNLAEATEYANGGAAEITGDRASFLNCTFYENRAGDSGGALYVSTIAAGYHQCVFANNGAGYDGGGLFNLNDHTVFENCVFQNNTAGNLGGGLCTEGDHATVKDCTFSGNDANRSGGGMAHNGEHLSLINSRFSTNNSIYKNGGGLSSSGDGALISGCLFEANSCDDYGGGMRVGASAKVVRSIFSKNLAYSGGGGASIGSPAIIEQCDFTFNITLIRGGGIYGAGDQSVIYRCIISKNYSGRFGGGHFCTSGYPTLTSTVIDRNHAEEYGGGFYFNGTSPTLTNCTLAGNTAALQGGGFYHYESHSPPYVATITNCILRSNTPQDFLCESLDPAISYTCIQGDYPGTGNIDANPRFVDETRGDLHLTYYSPCVDAGNNNAPGIRNFDYEGDDRFHLRLADMGADEFGTRLYCTGNFSPGGEIEAKLIGMPGTAPTGIFFGSGLLDNAVALPWGWFYLQEPWQFVPLTPMPESGALILPAVIPAEPPAPYEFYLQGLVGTGDASLTNPFVLEVE